MAVEGFAPLQALADAEIRTLENDVNDRNSVDLTAASLMFLICFLWALQSIGLKFTAVDASPVLQLGLRSGLAAALVWMVILAKGPRLPWLGGVAMPGWIAGLMFALNFYLVGEALNYTAASHVIVFLYTAPIFAAVGLHIGVQGERLSGIQWGGVAIASGSIAYAFLWAPADSEVQHASQLWGDFLALLGGAVWGAGTALIRVTTLNTAPATHVLFYQLAAAFVILTGFTLLTDTARLNPTTLLIANLVFQSVVVSFFSFFVWFWLLTRYKASQLGVYSLVTPLFGVVLGYWFLGEPLTSEFAIGSVGVLVGILTVTAYPWMSRRLYGEKAA